MATAETFINTALRLIGVKGAETPVTAQEQADALERLNDLGAQLEAEGYELGFTTLATIGDTVTIPAYANGFYKGQLAARLAPEYDITPPAFLVEDIESSRRSVIRELNRKSIGQTGTYQDIINSAFELSGVKSGSEPINSVELINTLPVLNDMMTSLEGDGFRLGYQVNTGTDLNKPHGLPDWCYQWIKAELSLKVSTSFGLPPNQLAMSIAKQGKGQAYNRTTEPPSVELSVNLPYGSSRNRNVFIGDQTADDLLTGGGDSLLTDEGLILEQKFYE